MKKYEIIAYCNTGYLNYITEEDLKILTGVNIAFGKCNPDFSVKVDHIKDIDAVKRMKEINPEIRVTISLGGAFEGGWSNASVTRAGRQRLIDTTVEFVRANNLDGVDLDGEFPTRNYLKIDARPEDKYTFTLLVEGFRKALDAYEAQDGKHYTVTMAAGSDIYMFDSIDMPRIASIMDYIQIMTYDNRGAQDDFLYNSSHQLGAGHHTNLYPIKNDPYGISIERSVDLFRVNGVPSEKIVIGSAFYNKRWENLPDVNHGLLQVPMGEVGEQFGPEAGVPSRYDILVENYIDKNGYVRYWDDDAKAPYLFNAEKGVFISYDDEESIKEKAKFCIKENLLGIMYWEYSCDHSHTLTRAHHEGFYGK